MATKVNLLHPSTGMMKPGYYGFSWTYLFFGAFVPLFRGELGVAALHFLFSFIIIHRLTFNKRIFIIIKYMFFFVCYYAPLASSHIFKIN